MKWWGFKLKIENYEYNFKLEKLWNEVSLDYMYDSHCLVYDEGRNLICLLYNEDDYYLSLPLFVTTKKPHFFYLITKEEWMKYYGLLSLMGKDKYDYCNDSSCYSKQLLEKPSIKYDVVDSSPIVKMVNIWIEKAIILGASDIHIESRTNDAIVRIRLDGNLKIMETISKDNYDELLARIKIMSSLDITKKMLPQDGKMNFKVKDNEYDLRVSTIPTVLGEKVVIRILDKLKLNNSFSLLNYNNFETTIINTILKEKSGMILVTGPTGCGKTTTMYTFLNELNDESNNIVTIEDPVEYTIDGINQIQVNQQAGLGFSGALRSILRQDPNIIMIGEIRDEETAQIAMRAALSGHLVISTLHTTSSVGAITRLLDMEIPRYLVSSALKLVLCQRLVKKLCPKCKKEIDIEKRNLLDLKVDDSLSVYEKRGCEYCFNTGYKGRLLLSEVLVIDDKIKELILSEASEKKIETYAKKLGMILLNEKKNCEIIKGNIDFQEI